MEKIVKVWKFIAAHVDALVAILVTILATTFGAIQNNMILLLVGISSALAVIAVGLIRDRQNREVLSEQLAELRKSLPGQLSATAFFRKEFPPEVKLDIERAREIWLVGYRLSRTIPTYITIFDTKLTRGEKIKVILVDPESRAAHYCNQSMSFPVKPEQFCESIRTNINRLKGLEGYKTGNLEIRLIDHPIPFGGYAINPNDPDGILYIKQFEYRAKTDGIRFILTSKDDIWYEIYRRQFMSIWETARPMQRSTGHHAAR